MKKNDHLNIPSESAPEVYINLAQVNFNPVEVELTCGLVSSNYEGVKPVVNIRMSPIFAKELVAILAQNMQKYEETVLNLDLKIKK